jgi:hypothetical protein
MTILWQDMTIKQWQFILNQNSITHGFWDKKDVMSQEVLIEKLMLIHEEISEAFGELRSGRKPLEIYFNPDKPNKPEGFPVELVDALIRILDLLEQLGIHTETVMKMKHEYNVSRPHMHGRTC